MNLTKEAQRVCMDKRRSAVFGRLFSFIGVFAIFILCFAFLSACDAEEVSSLFSPNDDFQVTFVLNNGEDNVVWHNGDELPSPLKDGYKFVGWCNDVTLNNLTSLDFDKLNLSSNIILYAKWEELPEITDVVFDDVSVVYDGTPHTLEVGNLPAGAKVVYDVENIYTNVGVYIVNAVVSLDGYKDLSLCATLTINKARVSGISFEGKEVDWDGNKHSLAIKGELPSEVSVEYVNNTQSEVGTYSVIARFSVSDNYEPIDDMSATLTIKEVYFLVSFVNGNGNVYTESVAHGCDVRQIPTLYPKDGYTASWENKKTTDILSNVTINAVYAPINYTINFVSVDEVVSEVEYTIEKNVDFADWQRDCYTFGGWYEDELCDGDSVDGIDKGNIGDKTYYAKWTPIEYTVHYHLNGGLNSKHNVNSGEEYVYTVESSKLELAEPSKTHYVFEGWYANADYSGMKWSYLPKGSSGNKAFYAKWAPEKYSVEYKLGGGINNDENPIEYNYESTEITLLPAEREHYDFVCWRDEKNEVVSKIADGTYGDVVLIAEWKAIEHTVYLCNEQGESFDKIVYTIESDDVVLKNQLKEYYNFVGWFDSNGNKIATIPASTAKDMYVYRKFSPVEFTILYRYNGGSGENVAKYTIESDDIILNNPTRDYYTFLGWYNGNEKVEKISKGSHGNITLQARWKAIEYSISYYGVEDTTNFVTSYTVESESIVLSTPRKDYYNFIGWYTSQDFGGDSIAEIDTKTPQNYSLYAKFTAIEYQISYILNGGSEVDNPTSYTVESDTITLLSPSKDNYTFIGWYCNGNCIYTIASGSHGNLTLEARWSSDVYTITYNGVSDTADYPKTYSIESGDVTLPSPSKDYYAFAGWYESADFSGDRVVVIKADSLQNYVLYARFTPVDYTITYDYNGGLDAQNPTTFNIESDTIVLKDTSKEYYEFVGWYVGDVKVESITKGSHDNKHLQARFVAKDYTITYHNVQDSSSFVNTYTIEDGEIALPQPQKDHYQFGGWYLSADFSTPAVEKVSVNKHANAVLYAKFTPIVYTITYDAFGATSNANKTSYTVEDDDFALLDIQKVGYSFVGWYDDETDNKVETVTTSTACNRKFYAKFNVITYTISYEGVDGLTNNNKTSYTVEDEDFVLLGVAKDGFDFLGWYDKQTDSKISTIDTSLATDVTLVAKWNATPVATSPFEVDDSGCLKSIDIQLLDSMSAISVPSSVGGVSVKSIASGVFAGIKDTVTQIEIAEGITSIASDLFAGLSKLEKLVLPSTIATMHKGMLTDCVSLCDLTLPFASFYITDVSDTSATKYANGTTDKYSIGLMYLFGEPTDASNCTAISVHYIELDTGTAKSYATNGEHFYLPDSLQNITVLGGDISARTFYGLTTLKSITLESSVSYVGDIAFAYCTGLDEVYIKGNNVNFGANVFAKCTDMVVYVTNDDVKTAVDSLTTSLTNVTCSVIE